MPCLHDLVEAGNDTEGILELLRGGEDPNTINDVGDTPLQILVSKDFKNRQDAEDGLRVAKELIRFGANVNVLDFEGKTPLILAVRAGNRRMVKCFLQANADINHTDNNGNSAMHHAVLLHRLTRHIKGQTCQPLEIVKTLLKYNPILDRINVMDRTPLIMAVKNHDLRIIKHLLKNNASVNFQNRQKESALHHALLDKVNVDVVVKLVRYSGDFGICNKKGQTPIDIYINRFNEFSSDELDDAKSVFKIYILLKNTLSSSQQQDIERVSREKNCRLNRFIGYCINETNKMLRDEHAPDYNFYNMALYGFFGRGNSVHVPYDVCDKVIDTIIKGQYPMYCDLIIAALCSRYLRNKFVEMCYLFGDMDIKCLNCDVLYQLSFYLWRFDMFNLMVACAPDNRWDQTFPYMERYQPYRNCSVM